MAIKIKQQDMLSQLIVDDSDGAKFCLLIGAGASSSSGIHTAGYLVEKWKEKLRIIESKDNPELKECTIHDDKFNLFYKKWKSIEAGNLINPEDYSILIEYFRPTPDLRQELIEKIVDDKYPSFGYLYLSLLIDAGYFNVIFTTNFDNLVNDALYKFVDSRPLVCSFDSGISSIRVASKRPKIIKLHGDYLFNNIKNTTSEVMNLTKNMDDKFKQFCQEYGLIVIGYSGRDDSVMDIIKAMLKDSEYLKMGLHWCIRSEDEIPQALKSSVGLSDRLHFYKIESFDVLMSDICGRAKISLPVEVTDPTKSKTIIKLTDSVTQTNENLSVKILDDAAHIVHSLQNITFEPDILIKEMHILVKRIQKNRGFVSKIKTIDAVKECIDGCERLLNNSASGSEDSLGFERDLNTAEKVDIYLIMGVAKISHAKVSENNREKVELYSEILEMLNKLENQADSLETSTISSYRTIFCRFHFNLACIMGLLAEIETGNLDRYCIQAVGHLNRLRGIDECPSYLEKIKRNEESDLSIFKERPEFQSFYIQ